MQLSHGVIVAVADGTKLSLFRNGGSESDPKLTAIGSPEVGGDNKSAGSRHGSSSANPDDSRLEEDSFAAATASLLNKMVLDGEIDSLIVVAAPKTLGELRKHWHKSLQAVLVDEIAKDLTGHSTNDIEAALVKH